MWSARAAILAPLCLTFVLADMDHTIILERFEYPGDVWGPMIYKTVGVPVTSTVVCAGFCSAESVNCTLLVLQGTLCHLGNGWPHTFLAPQTDTQFVLRDVHSKGTETFQIGNARSVFFKHPGLKLISS